MAPNDWQWLLQYPTATGDLRLNILRRRLSVIRDKDKDGFYTSYIN